MADAETRNIPWYASDKLLAALFIAGFAHLAWFLLSGWAHEREHQDG